MPWGDNGQGGNGKGPWGDIPKGDGGSGRPDAPSGDNIDELLEKMRQNMREAFFGRKNGKGGGQQSGGADNKKIFSVIAAVVGVLWLASGVYTVNTKEAGVVLRFGEYVRTTTPGMNYHLPAPIERVIKLRVTDRYRTEIGYNSGDDSVSVRRRPVRGDVAQSKEILMLTGDENIIDVNFEVQWQIDNAEKFLFNVSDPQKTIRDSAESAMREVIGMTPLNSILSEGRTAIQLQVKELMQAIMDSYDIGVKIAEINMKGVPPRNSIKIENISIDDNGKVVTDAVTTTVDEAFKDVQAAIINKEETINTAIARSNEIIPQSRGRAQRLLQEAKGYKEQVIAKAEGEAKRFVAVYDEYKKAKLVTKQRMYLETMEDILDGMDKVVVDSKGSNGVVPYLPLGEINKR